LKLRIDGQIWGFSRNKKGITTLTVKTSNLLQRDIDRVGKSAEPVAVILELELED